MRRFQVRVLVGSFCLLETGPFSYRHYETSRASPRASINKSPRIRLGPISLKTPRRVNQLWQMNLKHLWTPASGWLKRLSRTWTRTSNFSDTMLTNPKYNQLRMLLLPPLCGYDLAFFHLMSSWPGRFLVLSPIFLAPITAFSPFPSPKKCVRLFMQCYFAV